MNFPLLKNLFSDKPMTIAVVVPGLTANQKWPSPFYGIPPFTNSDQLLRRECAPGHALYKKPAVLIAKSREQDDFVYYLPECEQAFAIVHHTHNRETKPEWPHTVMFATLNDLILSVQNGQDANQ